MRFTDLPDLALRSYGGSVIAANDESFAEKESLIKPGPSRFQPHTFGNKGQVYDGWETRRRREPGHDWAIVRLGMPGVIRGVVIDTAWFKGNYPPYASVEACRADGYPSAAELAGAEWTEIVPKSPLKGDSEHEFDVAAERCFTHVRLNMFPDGGIARLRVHGEVVPDPGLLTGLPLDLAALENGARVTGCSDMFYSAPSNMLAPGLARHQAEGWETGRRRDEGNDWVTVRLAGRGVVHVVELDTANLLFNAPGWASVSGFDGEGEPGDGDWFEVLPRTRLQPDTRHRFRLDGDSRPVRQARLDVYPDGGMARLRLYGSLTPDGEAAVAERWNRLR
ncbi:allantoicase [Bailinhaonella thermotolerans]|uniref:Probable allantoicase n=1 Tax=Bailinhaonella thermotolerans TaxID=1070861 RepID=A0A3A4A9L8_9ACTN|nr:allantoicase [Bailinhaonella thermotolerans]RJL23597.1 allantoicase [Bailinhaonella thermotolerans]